MWKLFAVFSRRYVGRHFHALRLLKTALPPHAGDRPLVIFLNHASWWDPLACLLLATELFPDRTAFAPIDSAMLRRYAFFRRLGFFGIEPHTARGARDFLCTARAILSAPGHSLWLTPQGRFMDVRERPLRLERGLGVLATHAPDALFVPLAIEYTYWTEPRAEILVGFGEAVTPGCKPMGSAAHWSETFTQALEAAQDELATRSCRREPSEWLLLHRGRSGVNVIYDAWRRLRARLRGESFDAAHAREAQP